MQGSPGTQSSSLSPCSHRDSALLLLLRGVNELNGARGREKENAGRIKKTHTPLEIYF